jgi:hypothetical protein
MSCPRCGGHVTMYELGEAVSQVCEDCSYVGVLVDHRPEDTDIESWDDALTRFEAEFPDSVPDGVARVTDDTTPPDGPLDNDTTTEDGGFQLRGSPESTTMAKSGPEPGADFPTGETHSDVLNAGDETIVPVTDSDADHADNDPAAQPDEAGAAVDATEDSTEDDSSEGDAVTNERTADTDGTAAAKETVGDNSAEAEASSDDSATTAADERSGTSVTENQDGSNTDGKASTTGTGEDPGTKSDDKE